MFRKEKKPETRLFKTVRYIKNGIFAVLLVVLVGILIATMLTRVSGKSPSIMGYAVYRVSTGSMEPTLNVGDVILSHKSDKSEIHKGDIISFEGAKGTEFDGKIVTHRVITEPYIEHGEYYLVTKGDNNPVEDSPILLDSVLGKMVRKLDILAAAYEFFVTPWGLVTIILLIIAAFFNEIIIFVGALLGVDKKKPKKDSVEDIIERYKEENIKKALNHIEKESAYSDEVTEDDETEEKLSETEILNESSESDELKEDVAEQNENESKSE